MWHLTACKTVGLSFLIWDDFYHISELMLPTSIQRYEKKNHFFLLIQFKHERLTKFYKLSDATFYDHINTMYQFIKPFLDKKMSIFEEYGAVKSNFKPAQKLLNVLEAVWVEDTCILKS